MLSGPCVLLAHVSCAEESYGLTENSEDLGGLDRSLTKFRLL